MTVPPYGGDPDGGGRRRALLFLHAQSPAFRDIDLSALPGYADLSIDEALQVVARAPADEIPVSARLGGVWPGPPPARSPCRRGWACSTTCRAPEGPGAPSTTRGSATWRAPL